MKIGVPKEIKTHEYRVGLIPQAVAELRRDGHGVVIERGAGIGAGFADGEYEWSVPKWLIPQRQYLRGLT